MTSQNYKRLKDLAIRKFESERSVQGETMYVTIVNVVVKQKHIDNFITATRDNHVSSIREDGNMRFDILQSPEQPTHFILYEAYKTQQHAAAHKETKHYAHWRETVADWMAEPRKGVVYNGLYPE